MTYDEKAKVAEDVLKPLLTDDFLSTLALAVKTCDWSVDHSESAEFVSWCFDVAEKEKPDLSPLNY
jgi:hypothetical protein